MKHVTAIRQANIALIGNPNTGKTTLFNRLTGGRQRVGNYPGVTVAKHTGELKIGPRKVTVVDLPGAYSLSAVSPDERIAADVLTGRHGEAPLLAVCLADARQLRRSLFLACQIMDFGVPLVIAVNFMDELAADGLEIDVRLIAERLNVPVVSVVARSGQGLGELRDAIHRQLEPPGSQNSLPAWPQCLREATDRLQVEIESYSNRVLLDAEKRRVVFDPQSSYFELTGCPEGRRVEILEKIREPVRAGGLDPLSLESQSHFRFIGGALAGTLRQTAATPKRLSRGVDAVLTHRVLGPVIFAVLMFLVFQGIYSLSTPLADGIGKVVEWVSAFAASWLESMPVFRSLVCDGVLAGVGGVIVFLPQIILLFFFLAILEGTGYMARAAFLVDRLFGWCGLSGKSFVPLLSGSACAVPAILAARTIEDPRARFLTILVTPLMSCSARLPVYLLLIGAFIQPIWGSAMAALVLFLMQALGLVAALATSWVASSLVLGTRPQPFVIELPPYRMPAVRDVFWRAVSGARDFLQRAASVILAISIVVWALLYFPHQEGMEPAAQVEQSWLGRAGKTLEPVFYPAGFDWKITIGVLASFPAREVVVSTLGIINGASEDDQGEGGLAASLQHAKWSEGPRSGQPVFTIPTVFAMMVFFAFCLQCSSTVVVMAKEAGWRLALAAFLYMSLLAWAAAVIVYQLGSRIG